MHFMCTTHRQYILTDKDHAIRNWELWMAQGQQLHHKNQWQQAINYYGCSFEIGEWLLNTHQTTKHNNTLISYTERMMISGHSLAECFKQSDQKQCELDILIKVHKLLTLCGQQLPQSHWLLDNYIEKSLTNIQESMKHSARDYQSDNLWQKESILLH